MIELACETCQSVAEKLKDYNRRDFLSAAAGLLTIPALSANSVRGETLVHIAASYAKGTKKPNRTIFNETVNGLMGGSNVAMAEDPQEDVFISNILTDHGDLKIFNGLWEANDYFVQILADILFKHETPDFLDSVKNSCLSLLKLSDEIVNRSNLRRNFSTGSVDKSNVKIPKTEELNLISKRVIFTKKEIESIGITSESIEPFIISEEELFHLRYETIGNSTLETKPIVKFKEEYIVSIPSSIGIAIRNLLLKTCKDNKALANFGNTLFRYQFHQLTDEILREYRRDFTPIRIDIEKTPSLPPIQSLLLKNNFGHYFLTVLLEDEMDEVLNHGMSSFHTYSEDQSNAFHNFIFQVADLCKKDENFISGVVLLCHGGLGRGFNITFKTWPEAWGFSSLSLNDLLLLSGSKSKPLKEIFECLRQKRWAEDNGLKFSNINGDISYFGFWKDNDFKCVPDEIAIADNNMVGLYTDFVFPVRKNLRIETDKHGTPYIDNKYYRVERLTKDSYYEGMKLKPIYASIEHLTQGDLNGVVETNSMYIWFGVSEYTNEIKDFVYEWWSGFINGLEEALNYIASKVDTELYLVIQIYLDFSQIIPPDRIDLNSKELADVKIQVDQATCRIIFESNFIVNFSTPKNVGERKVLLAILEGVGRFLPGSKFSDHIENAVNHVLGDEGVRFIHLFKTYEPLDHLLASPSESPIFIDKTLNFFNLIKINKTLALSGDEIRGKKECAKILNKIVETIWSEIRSLLNTLNKRSFLSKIGPILGAIEQDRQQWKRTAKAVSAIYSKYDDVVRVAQQRESDRSLTSLCLRSLIEMSICECSSTGGQIVSDDILDELLSLCALLINTAADSDAIHWGLAPAEINFNKNGTYKIASNSFDEIVFPYLYGHFKSQFGDAISAYDELYDNEIQDVDIEAEPIPVKFDEALVAEYGLTCGQIIDCFAEIFDINLESKKALVYIPPLDLTNRIVRGRGLSADQVLLFLDGFSLDVRDKWDVPPAGYFFRDIAPWKYKRRLSCLVKPIIKLPDELILNAFLIKTCINYFLERVKCGEFNPDFFHSTQMRSYVGEMIDQRGAAFTSKVANELERRGWTVEKEIQMTKLGATKELGDIDILAVKDETMLIIECKKLQMAKTISEIADVCNRFKGQEKDELRKHLNRVAWVSKNMTATTKAIKYLKEISVLRNALLTSTEMPFQYKKDLPIGSNDIISFRKIDDWLKPNEIDN
ncbi:MAG: hypothetical protein QM709_11835 [Spongiibacteraceae bacterium]